MPSVVADIFSWAVIGLPAFLVAILVVVFFHELGHFSVARYFGVSIDVFSVGFGRELFGWTDRHGTRWKICALPLGGYVKFTGDANVASKPDEEELREMDPAQRAGVLHFKPLYQRALVVAAGPLANFVLAIVILTGLFSVMGRAIDVTEPVIGMVVEGSAAAEAGILEGDIIQSVDGRAVATFVEFAEIIRSGNGSTISIEIDRSGEVFDVDATPQAEFVEGPDGGETVYRVGVGSATIREPIGPIQAIGLAVNQTWAIIAGTMGYLGNIFTGQAAPDQLAGPLGIAGFAGEMAQRGVADFVWFIALISVSIGLVNLFPIPVLDGGHLLYYAIEAALGRPLGERAQEVGFRLGLAVVLSLMLLATFNDLVRFNLF
ncbi:MAG: RIP metalloprotease RseP [Micropepsaceae bacterium]